MPRWTRFCQCVQETSRKEASGPHPVSVCNHHEVEKEDVEDLNTEALPNRVTQKQELELQAPGRDKYKTQLIQTTWSLDGLDDTDAHDESHTLGCSSMPWEHDSKMLMSKKIYIAFSQHASAKASHRCI
eukprot:scaffold49155_cov20-Tisochrysis_lutea.AAC.1